MWPLTGIIQYIHTYINKIVQEFKIVIKNTVIRFNTVIYVFLL